MFPLGQVSAQRRPQMLVEGGDTVFTSQAGFRYHVVRNSQNIKVYVGGEAEILLVGGGGGGGHGYAGGGGGAGGVVLVPTFLLTPGTYAAVIGNGGAGAIAQGSGAPYGPGGLQPASSGQNTTFLGFTAFGGGRGASGGGAHSNTGPGNAAASGGSGGGSRQANENGLAVNTQTNGAHTLNGTSVIGYGNIGGPFATYPGGGGGAGAAGYSGSGGDGLLYSSFTNFRVGGGGNSASFNSGVSGTNIWGAGLGGTNGGPRQEGRREGSNALANTGSGGGGGGQGGFTYYFYWSAGGTGGSGLVIIKYRLESYAQ